MCGFYSAFSQDHEEANAVLYTNLDLLQKSVQKSIDKIFHTVSLSPGDSITVVTGASETGWIIDQAITTKLKLLGFTVFFQKPDSVKTHFQLNSSSAMLQVRYENMMKDGMFGSKKVERKIVTQLSSSLINNITGEVVYSGLESNTFSDTVAVDDIESVEQQGMPVTHATLPSENVLDKLVEPFVIIGATGVAIYLLFHIRS